MATRRSGSSSNAQTSFHTLLEQVRVPRKGEERDRFDRDVNTVFEKAYQHTINPEVNAA
ncbi:hypothetical protein SLV14_001663 [Streptomyces sp. Je 1-4]|uniref:hypothetical protein n=1 Tax=Streptomyces TaxID=1883 RepID=UPI0021DAF48D|nr:MULTISPECIES: hypothetical protein [unclassified Streptomyces]UYB39198.1 hypothetical protein SLV14_001663 [Streptomyces sp. Je 1-4]UZQ35213.1 hypothetical protein SLV14N_001663 [Streptomyces sp. Je 1-4] [Streptomyces sp. Je 1-4 4N24]UZQ42631.1 hypothetical protein SLV14NA_001663 [Streptomyces sp. Je 1-4] [Streptomyces sp. Je 1-4 4N24_ara]